MNGFSSCVRVCVGLNIFQIRAIFSMDSSEKAEVAFSVDGRNLKSVARPARKNISQRSQDLENMLAGTS